MPRQFPDRPTGVTVALVEGVPSARVWFIEIESIGDAQIG